MRMMMMMMMAMMMAMIMMMVTMVTMMTMMVMMMTMVTMMMMMMMMMMMIMMIVMMVMYGDDNNDNNSANDDDAGSGHCTKQRDYDARVYRTAVELSHQVGVVVPFRLDASAAAPVCFDRLEWQRRAGKAQRLPSDAVPLMLSDQVHNHQRERRQRVEAVRPRGGP